MGFNSFMPGETLGMPDELAAGLPHPALKLRPRRLQDGLSRLSSFDAAPQPELSEYAGDSWNDAPAQPVASGAHIEGATPNNLSESDIRQSHVNSSTRPATENGGQKPFLLAQNGQRPFPGGDRQTTQPPGSGPASNQYPSMPDVSGQLADVQGRMKKLQQPMSTGRKIFSLISGIAPIVGAAALGNSYDVNDAASMVSQGNQNRQAQRRFDLQNLQGEADRLQGVQERQFQFGAGEQDKQRQFELEQQHLGILNRPEVQQTDDGPIQWNPRSKTWDAVTVNGKPVQPKSKGVTDPKQGYAAAVADAIQNNRDPDTDPTVQRWKAAALGLQKITDKPDTATEIDQRYDRLRADQLRGKKLNPDDAAFLESYRERKTMGPSAGATIRVEGQQGLDVQKRVNEQFDKTLDADTRLSRMEASYQKGLKGDQQAMLALLTDHIGMTLGMQKGARITKDILNEAQVSQPFLEKIGAKFDSRGYLSGVTLGPEQMKQMLDLGYEARNRQWGEAFNASQLYGAQPPRGAQAVYQKRNPDYRIHTAPHKSYQGADYVQQPDGSWKKSQ